MRIARNSARLTMLMILRRISIGINRRIIRVWSKRSRNRAIRCLPIKKAWNWILIRMLKISRKKSILNRSWRETNIFGNIIGKVVIKWAQWKRSRRVNRKVKLLLLNNPIRIFLFPKRNLTNFWSLSKMWKKMLMWKMTKRWKSLKKVLWSIKILIQLLQLRIFYFRIKNKVFSTVSKRRGINFKLEMIY